MTATPVCDNPDMKPEYLYAFYEYALLPQLGIENEVIGWQKSVEIGPDETAHYFSTSAHTFILIFEDYDGLGRDPGYIEEALGLLGEEYTFVQPKAASTVAPSIHFILQTPYKYAPDITGTFTLLKLRQGSSKNAQSLVRIGVRNNNGWVRRSHQEKS